MPIADLGRTKATCIYERRWTSVHLGFVVADLDLRFVRLTALGATLDQLVKQREYGRIANMADPFGNGIDVIKFTGDGYGGVCRDQ